MPLGGPQSDHLWGSGPRKEGGCRFGVTWGSQLRLEPQAPLTRRLTSGQCTLSELWGKGKVGAPGPLLTHGRLDDRAALGKSFLELLLPRSREGEQRGVSSEYRRVTALHPLTEGVTGSQAPFSCW